MTFEEILVSTLNSGSITCYPLEKPQDAVLPAVVYDRVSTVRQRIQGAKSTFNQVRMGLTVYGSSYANVKDTCAKVIDILDENQTNFTLSILSEYKDYLDSSSGLYYSYVEFQMWGHFN